MRDFVRAVLGGLGLVGATIAASILGVPDASTALVVPPHPREEQVRKLVRGHGRLRDSATIFRLMMGSVTAAACVVGLFYHPALLVALGTYILSRWSGREARAAQLRIEALRSEADRLHNLRREGAQTARSLTSGPLRAPAESAIRLYTLPPRMPPATDILFRGRVLGQLDVWIERLDAVARARVAFDSAMVAPPPSALAGTDTVALGQELARAKTAGDERRVHELKARLDASADVGAARARAAQRAQALDDAAATLASQIDGIGPQILAHAGADLTAAMERALASAEETVVRMEELAGLSSKDVESMGARLRA